MNQHIHGMLCDVARQNGQLEQMTLQVTSRTLEADELLKQYKDLLRRQKGSMFERAAIEAEHAVSKFWLEQLQDTATNKSPFITYCHSRHVHPLNALMAQVLHELNQDTEGIAT